MSHVLRNFIAYKIGFIINFVMIFIIGTRLIELVLNANKIFALLYVAIRQLPQILRIETLGVPAFSQVEAIIVFSIVCIVAMSAIPRFV